MIGKLSEETELMRTWSNSLGLLSRQGASFMMNYESWKCLPINLTPGGLGGFLAGGTPRRLYNPLANPGPLTDTLDKADKPDKQRTVGKRRLMRLT